MLLSEVEDAAQRCASGRVIPRLAALDEYLFVQDNDVAQTAATGKRYRMEVELAQGAMSQLVCPKLLNGLVERLNAASGQE